MKLRVGFEMLYEFPQPTPMIMVLGTHFTRASDIVVPDLLTTRPSVAISPYRDLFGNWCSRIVAPAGAFRLAGDGIVRDSGLPDPVFPNAFQHAVEALPADTLVYLLGSRYCETDRLSDIAWKLFEQTPPGWARVQAICDFVHRHITFGHEHARATKTAREAYDGGSWHMFDPRNNTPRIGRVLIAQGRDAADVPIVQTFGPNTLLNFKVWTDEVA
ncbi:transglutaminase-like putative cysteine protease [Bradyrhizobium sp. JR7.2]|uniref:transglutaminase family protein n=1 Tax=Bradyrhizobium sp. JR7.2 TaxID=3156375 RepID=UPI0033956228